MLGVPATSTFAGSVSVKLMPDCAGLPAPLVMVKVRVDVPPTSMVVGANALLSEACTTVTVWLVTPFSMPAIAVTLAAPLVYGLAVLLTTSTLTVQVLAPAAALTPVPATVKVPAPATAVMVGAPPQLFTTFGVGAITRLAGSASVNVRLVRAMAPAGLAMVKVSVLGWPMPTVAGANALVSVGSARTVSPDAVTELVTFCVAPMLAAVLLYGPPGVFEVTSTVITHEACAALMDAAVTVMVPLAATAATAPVPDGHVVVTFGTAATTTFAGNVSVKLMPACAGLPALLVSVKVSVDVAPWSMVVGANALLSEGWFTVRLAFAVPPVIAAGPVADTAPLVLL